MSFWMVNYVCSLVLWDNLVCVFYVFSLYFISHGDQWALCHYEHMLWEWISMHRKSRKLFSQKSSMDSLTFCAFVLWESHPTGSVCGSTSWSAKWVKVLIIWLSAEGFVSSPVYSSPIQGTSFRVILWMAGSRHCCEHERHEFHVDCQSSRFSMTVGDATMWCAWSRHYRLWRPKLDQNLTHVCEIRTDHQCYQLRSVVALIEIVWTCLNCYLACHNSLQVKWHVRFERLGDDLHSVKSQAVQAFYLRWRSERKLLEISQSCGAFRIVTKGCGGESFRCTSWSHKASWIED